ncbi:ABC transporter substrate-binding protein [Martelella endophytica]|uniref:ABC transporter substrate-binding protein n=1 Tax=Martelella endophytica TaxID=1486262 RepID=UPI0005F0F174|nr:sugar ABC transporter substrate-binding protein [Martelella endophytica]
MLKSILKCSAATFLAAGVIATSASAEDIRVYFNAGHGYDTYLKVFEEFEEANPGFHVAFERYQWPDLRTKLVADFAAGNPPDLVAEPGAWVPEFAQQGLLYNLNDYVARDQAEFDYPGDWQDVSVEKNTVDGSYYGVQIHLTCATLLYNVDMLKAAGYDKPPTNWEEFREVAKATTKNGVFGFAPNAAGGYIMPWIYQNGGQFYDAETGKIAMGSDAAAGAIQFVADLIHKDHSAPVPVTGADYEGPQRLFTAGRAAMIITGPWDINPIRTGNPNLNWAVAPSLKEVEQGTLQGGVSLMVPKDAKHPEQAWDLIKRLTAVDVEVATSLQYSMTMPRKSWLESPEVQADPILGQFGACLPYSRDATLAMRQAGKYKPAIDEVINGAIDEVLYSNKPAAEVMAKAQDEANALIDNE